MANIESRFIPNWKLGGILARKIYDQRKFPIENVTKLKTRIKSARQEIPNELD